MRTIEESLQARKLEGNYRKLPEHKGLIDFCSNDYLGFAKSEKLKAAINSRLQAENIEPGSGAARLISGNYPALEKLEKKIADFHKSEAALLFNTGYLANLALLSCIAKRTDTVLYDELSHASIRDGIRLSFAKSYSFRHNDPDDLGKKIKSSKGNIFIAIESLYSMDGDFAPLALFSEIANEKGASLVVDEAHSNGLYAEHGEGKAVEEGIAEKIFARIVTFGKALGVQGAAILCSDSLKEYLVNFSRPFIYSTAMSPYQALLIDEAYNLIKDAGEERRMLFKNISVFNSLMEFEDVLPSPIQIKITPANPQTLKKAEKIQKAGFDVRPILSPTVQKGRERLRICLHSFNTEEQIKSLVKLLRED